MKKKLLTFLFISISLISLFGCTNNKNTNENKTVEIKKNIYIKNIQKLKKAKQSTEDLPFDIDVKYEKIKGEIRYQVIIDNPKVDVTDIMALCVHNKQTDDVFPSIGIFDKKIDLTLNKKPSGVILVGYFPYKGSIDDLKIKMKVLIEYKIDNQKYTSYYVTKK